MKSLLVVLCCAAFTASGCGRAERGNSEAPYLREEPAPDEEAGTDRLPSPGETYTMPDFEVEERFIIDEPAEEPEPDFPHAAGPGDIYPGEGYDERDRTEGAGEPEYDPRQVLSRLGFNYHRWDFIRAAGEGDAGAVELFLEAGMDPDSVNSEVYRETALIRAARQGHPAVAGILVEAGAAVNRRDANGETALGYALMFDHREVAEILETAGGAR